MKLKPFFALALLSAGCYGKIAEETADIDPASAPPGSTAPGARPTAPTSSPTPIAPPTSSPGNGGAGGTCWQSLPSVPAATGASGTLTSCSLAGTWAYDVTFSHPEQYKMVWAFDDQGRAVGGPEGTNLCEGFSWYGNYTLGTEGFAALRIRGEGAPACGHNEATTFKAAFSPDCQTFLLQRIVTDGCTGGSLFYEGKMTKID